MTGGALAFFVGLGLAGATAFGIVQQQTSASTQPVDTSAVSYGNN